MNSPTNVDCEIVAALKTSRNFILNLPHRVPDRIALIQTILESSSEAFVWPQPKSAKPRPMPAEFLTPERGCFRMDAAKADFTGFGPFWHLGERGSIAFRLPRVPDAFEAVLTQCPLHPGCSSVSYLSRNQLAKGNSPGAIRYCDQVVRSGEITFLLPQFGTTHIAVFAAEEELMRLYRLASRLCPPRKVNVGR